MTVSDAAKIGGVLLAAGGSARLGTAKQFLVYQGKTLLRRAAETLTASKCSPVIVVTGSAHADAIREIEGLDVHTCRNDRWEIGMGSSVKLGLKQLLEIAPETEAVVITLCDVPFVTSENIDSLWREFETSQNQIVAAEYDNTRGVPALFSRDTFADLASIPDEKGARDLIRSGTYSVHGVPMPEAAHDIDTRDDLSVLRFP